MSERKMLSDGGVGLHCSPQLHKRTGTASPTTAERGVFLYYHVRTIFRHVELSALDEVEALELAKFPCLSSSDNELNDPMGSDSLSLLSPLPIGPP